MEAQKTWYVHAQATGQQTGTDWINAFTDLQSALAQAAYGDEIWIAQGVYKPTTGTDRNQSFNLVPGVRMLGGFAGNESQADQRNPDLYETILSGDIGVPGDSSDNVYHVLFGLGLDAHTRLDGLTIRDGYSLDVEAESYEGKGAGLLLLGIPDGPDCAPHFERCRFLHNSAKQGGGIYINWQNTFFGGTCFINPSFTNCLFEKNRSKPYDGAGICSIGKNRPGDTMRIRDCIFRENLSDYSYGAGISFGDTGGFTAYLTNTLFERDSCPGGIGAGINCKVNNQEHVSTTIILDSCAFKANHSSEAAGFNYDAWSGITKGVIFNLFVNKCRFEANVSRNGSGAAFYLVGYDSAQINVQIRNSNFYKNACSKYVCYVSSRKNSTSNVYINNCSFTHNQPISQGADDMRVLGIIGDNSLFTKAFTRIENCLFANNDGVISVYFREQAYITTEFINCTFFNNDFYILNKTWYDSYAAPNSPYYNNMKLRNCIFWEPGAETITLLHNVASSIHYKKFDIDYTLFNFSLSQFELPAPELAPANIKFNIAPMFEDSLAGDFRLRPCSPLVNAGDNASVDIMGSDLNGAPRLLNARVDFGAYETADTCAIVASAISVQRNTLQIAPNPSNGLLNIMLPSPGPWLLTVADWSGKVLFTQHAVFSESTESFDLSALPAGFYTVNLAGKTRVVCGKWVKN
ncbi:MAG: T9SS type A sorting domain-containing protein [Bacteroidota bacterium]